MNTRADMQRNDAMDAKHELYKQALIEYLTTKAGREERKEIVKEAISEWLDDKFKEVGKWSVAGITAASLAVLAYFMLTLNGFHR